MRNDEKHQKRFLLIAAPFKGDSASLNKLFASSYPVCIHGDLNSLSGEIGPETGLIMLTEEALKNGTSELARALERQPPWSEIPIILLASNQGRSGRNSAVARSRLPDSAGHVVVMERPLSSASLISAVTAAWRARDRQFDMRDRVAELAEERGRLGTLLENIPVGVCFMNEQGNAVISNRLYRQNLPGEELPTASAAAVTQWVGFANDGTPLEPHMLPGARALRGETVTGVTFARTAPEGGTSWMRVCAAPLRGEAQTILGAACVFADINEEKQAELSLRRFNEELEVQVQARTQALNDAMERLRIESDERASAEEQLRQSLKMEAVGQLTGGIAHDFNNMLTGVIGAIDLIRLRLADGRVDGVDRYMDAAHSSAQRAAALTQRLLAFSRRQPLEARPLAVNPLVRSLHDLLKRSVTEKIEVRLDLCDDDPWISADENQLENALLNLVINSRDAMPKGGVLTITTSVRKEPIRDIGVADADTGEHVCIEVKDTGVGIPERLLDKILDPFFTTKPIGQGTGLGLSMVYGFARQSGGTLSVESNPGNGTSVSICLPSHLKAERIPAALEEFPAAGCGQTILLVEDDESVRLINQQLLTELGYRVISARDATEALQRIEHIGPLDLLITDVGLPGMNGRQLAEVIQQRKPGLPVLFLTGYAEGAIDSAGFLGTDMQLLTKPFTVEALARQLAGMLHRNCVPDELPHEM